MPVSKYQRKSSLVQHFNFEGLSPEAWVSSAGHSASAVQGTAGVWVPSPAMASAHWALGGDHSEGSLAPVSPRLGHGWA